MFENKEIINLEEKDFVIEIELEDESCDLSRNSSFHCEEEYTDEIIDLNSSSTNTTDYPLEDFSKESDCYSFTIHLPEKTKINRNPGCYVDVKSKYKKKHNHMILDHSSFLDEKINALILDGKKMRTSRTLMKAGKKLNMVHIVEFESSTFMKMSKRIKKGQLDPEKVQVYNSHIMDHILRGIDKSINVVYLDVMCNFFDSERTKGSQGIILQLMRQLERPKVLFAATFCLRTNIYKFTYKNEIDEILYNLHKIFEHFNYNYISLIKKSEMRYKGQRLKNHGMMFVIYKLIKQ